MKRSSFHDRRLEISAYDLRMNRFTPGSTLVALTKNHYNTGDDETAARNSGWRHLLSEYHEPK